MPYTALFPFCINVLNFISLLFQVTPSFGTKETRRGKKSKKPHPPPSLQPLHKGRRKGFFLPFLSRSTPPSFLFLFSSLLCRIPVGREGKERRSALAYLYGPLSLLSSFHISRSKRRRKKAGLHPSPASPPSTFFHLRRRRTRRDIWPRKLVNV